MPTKTLIWRIRIGDQLLDAVSVSVADRALVDFVGAERDGSCRDEKRCSGPGPSTEEPAPMGKRLAQLRRRRPEARPLAELSDFQPAKLSDFGPTLTVTSIAYRLRHRAIAELLAQVLVSLQADTCSSADQRDRVMARSRRGVQSPPPRAGISRAV